MIVFFILSYAVTAVAAVCDIRRKELPYPVLISAGLVSAVCMIFRTALGEDDSLAAPLLSLIPGAILLATALLSGGGMGLGDGIFAMLVGPVFGVEIMSLGILAALFMCAAVSVFLLVFGRAGRKNTLPYIPFLLAGMGVAGCAIL